MLTKIRLWSDYGHTPITHRTGSYCDELLYVELDCESPEAARAKVLELMRTTTHAVHGYFYMPAWWNQNTCQGWL